MTVNHGNVPIILRALSKEDLPILVRHFSSMKVHFFTKGLFAQTLENEVDWYEKNRRLEDSVVWAIVPIQENWGDVPIGVTAIHDMNRISNSCTSGIIIWDSTWWGRGIASSCHLGRTLFAADYLNRWKINSCVRVENAASRKALQRVGYTIWGTEPCTTQREGRWLDTYHLTWIHPGRVQILFPQGAPDLYISGIQKANEALALARKVVEFP